MNQWTCWQRKLIILHFTEIYAKLQVDQLMKLREIGKQLFNFG